MRASALSFLLLGGGQYYDLCSIDEFAEVQGHAVGTSLSRDGEKLNYDSALHYNAVLPGSRKGVIWEDTFPYPIVQVLFQPLEDAGFPG